MGPGGVPALSVDGRKLESFPADLAAAWNEWKKAHPDLAGAFDIRSIPTLMILRDKVLLFSQAGALAEAALEDLVRQVRALDMEKVRAEIAAQDAKGATA